MHWAGSLWDELEYYGKETGCHGCALLEVTFRKVWGQLVTSILLKRKE